VVEVGGAGTLERSLKATTPGGTVSVIGVLAGASAPLSTTPILMNNLRLQGILVGSREGFEEMCRAMALHHLRPTIDRTFEFEEATVAFEHLKGATHFGKVAIRLG
jgi:NADPH:quinone reductase-like Zn-dependent oxidoreductase